MKLWLRGTTKGLRDLRDRIDDAIENGKSEGPNEHTWFHVQCKKPHTRGNVIVWVDFEPEAEGEWAGHPSETYDWRWNEDGVPNGRAIPPDKRA